MTFTGWVDHIFEPTQYDMEFSVRNYEDETAREAMIRDKNYPQTLKFTASVKSGAAKQLEGVGVGDRIVVRFFLYGSSGVSKSSGNYYCINKLNISKKDGITVLERHGNGSTPENEPVIDYVPF